jgi:hypothetical protein
VLIFSLLLLILSFSVAHPLYSADSCPHPLIHPLTAVYLPLTAVVHHLTAVAHPLRAVAHPLRAVAHHLIPVAHPDTAALILSQLLLSFESHCLASHSSYNTLI